MEFIRAVVQKIIENGDHGPFAVALSEDLEGSVTFSLDKSVWQESDWPNEGMIVFLGEIRKKRAGWRANYGRFWKPSDEQRAKSKKIEFLYPSDNSFCFDPVCREIVLELEKRNWDVPGMTVDFDEYGSGELKFRRVSYIRSEEFELFFCRVQRRIPNTYFSDTAGISRIKIPKKELQVYEDKSGPTLYVYVGDDWERDRQNFMNGQKVHSKLEGKPRTYLMYSGSESTTEKYRYRDRQTRYLLYDNDLDREYTPTGKEPKYFFASSVFKEFAKYLKKRVLRKILKVPVPEKRIDRFFVPVVPFPGSIGPIFCFGENSDALRIVKGKKDPNSLDPVERYGMTGSGYRLMPYSLRTDETVPKIARDGFLWCGLGSVSSETHIENMQIPGHYRCPDRERFIIRVIPNRANGIYVADHAEYEKRRKELGDALLDGRDLFTDDEVSDFTRARARTIVPISEYDGSYKDPIILINRELGLDEVVLVLPEELARKLA